MTTKHDIEEWLDIATRLDNKYLIVVCDTFDHSDYPVYCRDDEECLKKYHDHNGKNMQRVMEVYDLSMNIGRQLHEGRAMNLPKEKDNG